MSDDAIQKAEAFRDEILTKINNIVQEFADGKLSREQFQTIYARYTERLTIANMAMVSGETTEVEAVQTDGTSTLAIRDGLKGKAIGLLIYHNSSGTMIDTMGEPDIPVSIIGPLFNDISERMENNRRVEPTTKRISEKQWLLLLAGDYTTIATQFRNEPALYQIRELERLHRDFELANKPLLSKNVPVSDALAYPFYVFISKSKRKR